jgi:hypothetical protein
MADDDEEVVGPDAEFEEELEEEEPAELTDDDLDDEALVEDDEFGEIEDVFDADADEAVEQEEDAETEGPVRKSVPADEDDDDDDMVAPDDVEADLDTILKDRLVAADDDGGDDDDDEPEDRSEPGDRLQPKRADERLCPSCFLLVRNNAPICPVGDDECPLFSKRR